MKRFIVWFALAAFMAVAVAGCTTEASAENKVPPKDSGQPAVMVELTIDQLTDLKHVTKAVEITYPGSLIVTLAANPTTGYRWPDNPKIDNTGVLGQYEHNFVASQSAGVVGAPGKDVWTFKPVAKGTTIVSFDYSRPWDGGEKNEWTVELTVTVK